MKPIRLAIALFFILIVIGCGRLIPNRPYDANKSPLRVATYNVNWGKGRWHLDDPSKTIAAIASLKADVVLLQETTAHWQQLCRRYLKKQYPYQRFKHYENAGGLAFLSKTPIHTVHYQTPSYGWHPFWIARIRTRLGNVTFVNLHLTPPLNGDKSIGFMGSNVFSTAKTRLKEIKDIFASLSRSRRVVIAGDFNEGDRSQSMMYLKKHGLQDATEAYDWPTWYWRAGPFLLQDRYDRVFYSPDLTAVKSQSLQAGSSDHFPVIVDFN